MSNKPSVTNTIDRQVKFNMNIPISLRKKWRRLAAETGITMTALMIDAMEKTYFPEQKVNP